MSTTVSVEDKLAGIIELNWLTFTGPVTVDTPAFVLSSIYNAHGLGFTHSTLVLSMSMDERKAIVDVINNKRDYLKIDKNDWVNLCSDQDILSTVKTFFEPITSRYGALLHFYAGKTEPYEKDDNYTKYLDLMNVTSGIVNYDRTSLYAPAQLYAAYVSCIGGVPSFETRESQMITVMETCDGSFTTPTEFRSMLRYVDNDLIGTLRVLANDRVGSITAIGIIGTIRSTNPLLRTKFYHLPIVKKDRTGNVVATGDTLYQYLLPIISQASVEKKTDVMQNADTIFAFKYYYSLFSPDVDIP